MQRWRLEIHQQSTSYPLRCRNEKMYKASKGSSKPAEAPVKLSEVREPCVDSNTRKSSGSEHQSKMTDVSRMAFTCAAMLENKGWDAIERNTSARRLYLHQCRMDNPSHTKLLINIEICWHGIRWWKKHRILTPQTIGQHIYHACDICPQMPRAPSDQAKAVWCRNSLRTWKGNVPSRHDVKNTISL